MTRLHLLVTGAARALGVAALLGAALPVASQQPAAAPQRGLRDRAELEAFLDGVMAANLRDKHVAGATVAVVKDGALLLAKGYGFADVDRRRPVSAERTLFRIGSISKLFTWTAIMQLAEQGKVDLDADVNRYLDFRIPATYPQPITLRHILVHTPGFEEDGRDLFSEDTTRIYTNARWVATHIPTRVRPPGTFSSYSNYATALAGYVVERVSGEPWEAYIERHILQPLGMTQTTGRQPVPASLAADMSVGYQWAGGRFAKRNFEIVNGAAPAGSLGASASDMATFMLAHLGNGAHPNGTRILAESTAVRMYTRDFTHDERIPGFALGFYEKSSHGLRIIGHGGDTQWFHSDMALIPSERLGIFVSYNTDTGGELSFGPFLTQFLDHYYPVEYAVQEPPAEAERQAALVAGSYAFNRRNYSTFQKVLDLTGAVGVRADTGGRIVVSSPLGEMHMVPVAPWLWREELGERMLAFREAGGEPTTYGFLSIAPMMALERIAWYERPPLHWMVLGLGLATFLITLVAAASRAVRRRLGTAHSVEVLPGHGWLVALSAAFLAFPVALVAAASGGLRAMLATPMTGVKVALAFPVLGALFTVGALLTLGAICGAVRNGRAGAGSRAARWRYGTTVAIALLFLWSLHVHNLLGWRM